MCFVDLVHHIKHKQSFPKQIVGLKGYNFIWYLLKIIENICIKGNNNFNDVVVVWYCESNIIYSF